jgi:hypothetical protein
MGFMAANVFLLVLPLLLLVVQAANAKPTLVMHNVSTAEVPLMAVMLAEAADCFVGTCEYAVTDWVHNRALLCSEQAPVAFRTVAGGNGSGAGEPSCTSHRLWHWCWPEAAASPATSSWTSATSAFKCVQVRHPGPAARSKHAR